MVVTAIQAAAVQAQIDATRQLMDLNSNMVEILRYQYTKGYAGRLDVVAQESQLAQVIATLPPLLKQSAQLRDLLAVLAGRFPNQAPAEKFELSSLQLPEEIAGEPAIAIGGATAGCVAGRGQPARCQRADRHRHREPAARTSRSLPTPAARRCPSINCFRPARAFGVWARRRPHHYFKAGNCCIRNARRRQLTLQAAEQYRSTVLTAFQNVADTLTALEQDAKGLKAAATAADDAQETLDLSQRQWNDGYISYLALLSAEQAYQQARINLVQAQANRYADTAALFQALGGGWWHRVDLTKDKNEK